MAAKKKSSADDELAQLQGNPDAAAIARALESRHARVVAAAAAQIKARALEGHGKALQAAYARFAEDGLKRDPGCKAKLAVLEALDFTESVDAAPFLAAASLRQLEPAWGPPVDTATGCRSRAALALARMGHEDAVLIAGTLLADPEHVVRATAADALGHSGVRAAAGALLHKLGVGDDEPAVLLACLSGLLALAPEFALARLIRQLEQGGGEEKELAALALGQSARIEAAQALLRAAEACVLSAERAVLWRALGLHRSELALRSLLEVIGSGNAADARAALRALAPRRFEKSVQEQVGQAVAARPELASELREAFGED